MSSGDTPKGFTGTISLRLTDLIQMVCLARSDLVIGVSSRKGRGTIHIRSGRIHHARTEKATGEEAFLEVLRWGDGRFEIQPYSDNNLETVHKPWEHLLLEAIRSQDEDGSSGADDHAGIFDEIDNLFGETVRSTEGAVPPEEPRPRVRVLIVDDSVFFAGRLKVMLEEDGDIEVVGIAKNGTEALRFLESGTAVDLVTLDVEMPVMPGDTTLKHIMIRYRVPVLIVSSIQPESMGKLFDFLQLGAVEFFSKPTARDDLEATGVRLRALARGAAAACVDHFRRIRRRTDEALPAAPVEPAGEKKVLVVVGAEGAHMDWFRLPLRDLCRRRIVLGLQKLPEPFIPAFARFVEAKTGTATACLSGTHSLEPGRVYFGNACRDVEFLFSEGGGAVEANILGAESVKWKLGVQVWLNRLAEQGAGRVSVYLSSAVDALPDSTVTKVLGCGPTLILAPSTSVLCGQLVDSIRPFTDLFPGRVCYSSPERLPEVLEE